MMQWWCYVVRNPFYQGTYLRKRNAVNFANDSQKVRGGTWCVYRVRKIGKGFHRKLLARFEGVRYE